VTKIKRLASMDTGIPENRILIQRNPITHTAPLVMAMCLGKLGRRATSVCACRVCPESITEPTGNFQPRNWAAIVDAADLTPIAGAGSRAVIAWERNPSANGEPFAP